MTTIFCLSKKGQNQHLEFASVFHQKLHQKIHSRRFKQEGDTTEFL